jgi:hypothetical protein
MFLANFQEAKTFGPFRHDKRTGNNLSFSVFKTILAPQKFRWSIGYSGVTGIKKNRKG